MKRIIIIGMLEYYIYNSINFDILDLSKMRFVINTPRIRNSIKWYYNSYQPRPSILPSPQKYRYDKRKEKKKISTILSKKKKTKKQKVAHVHQRHPRNYSLWQEGRHEANKSRTKLHRSAANRQLQRKIVRRVGSTSIPPLPALLLPRIHPRTRWKKKIFVDTQPGSRNFSRHIDAGRRRDMPSRRVGTRRKWRSKGKKECLRHGRQNNPSHFSANFSLSFSLFPLSFASFFLPPELPRLSSPWSRLLRRLNFNATNEILTMSLMNNTMDK